MTTEWTPTTSADRSPRERLDAARTQAANAFASTDDPNIERLASGLATVVDVVQSLLAQPVKDPWAPSKAAESLANRRQALEVASRMFGSVTYTRDGDPSPADEVLAAARRFAAFLDADQAPNPTAGPSEIRFRIPQGEVPPAKTEPAPETCRHTTRTPIEARYGCCAPVKEA